MTEARLHEVREAMDWGGTLSVHGPFMDLSPGAVDSKIAAATLDRFMQVMVFLEVLLPDVVVFHSGYEKWKYAGEVELWLGQSVKTWSAVMEKASRIGVKVAIENIVDTEPDNLCALVDRMADPDFGLCLDVGHRELFSELSIGDWVDGMGGRILELHLHDNHGTGDDHLPIGDGRVDFGTLFDRLKALPIDPVYTLEAHSTGDAALSLERLGGYLRS